MKNHYFSSVLIFLCIQVVTACSTYDLKIRLSIADRLMKERPDSSLAIIEDIQSSRIHSSSVRARFSLLRTMAIDRTGIDTTDLNLIKDAADYYRFHGNAHVKALASFYEGRIYFNCSDYLSAYSCLIRSLTESDKTDDEWLKGMICYYLSSVLNNNHLNAEELKYSQQSYDHFCQHGNQNYIDRAINILAMANHNNRLFDVADSLYAMVTHDSELYKYALLGRAENAIGRDNPDIKAALAYYEEANKQGAPFALSNLYQYAYALVLDGQTDLAYKLIARLDNEVLDVKSEWWRYAIEKELGNYRNALLYLELYSHDSDSYIISQLTQSLYKAESNLYSAQKDQAKSRTKIVSLIMIALALVLSLIIFLVLGITTNRRKKIESERNTLLQRVNDIQGLLDTLKAEDAIEKEHTQELSSLQAYYVSMYREQFSEIGKLIGTNPDISPKADTIQRKHLLFINEILSEISSNDGNNKKFEERVNRSLDNIMHKIRIDFPELTEESIRLICLIIVGFKDPAIATIMNKSISAISTRKSRLKKHILEADSQNHELYEAFLK